jgi:hypothetical protein
MDKGKLYSVSALFDKPDEVIHASEETVKAGYTKFYINTPYPLHGMDSAMNLRPTKVGFITLVFGLLGAGFAFGFMSWVAISSYPLVIGGKPYFTWPAFVPITFEITVLSAAVFTVIGLLFILFRFPAVSHPVHDTDYMRKVSLDKFGINILTIDPLFDEHKVKDFLSSVGGKDIEPIYYEVVTEQPKMFDLKFIVFLVIVSALTAGVTYFTLNRLLFMQPFTWMWFQPKVVTQSENTFFPDGYSMRMPVEGTVARGFIPYKYEGMPDSLVKNMSNPLPSTPEVITRGKEKFNTYCSPCHGYYARGDSRLHGFFPSPPSLHTDKVRNWSDGYIYNTITNGQNNIMPGYAKSIPRDDRWAIIHYIRVLQRSQNASDSDLVHTK